MQYSGTLLNEILGPESPKELSALLDDRLSTEALTTEYNYLLAHPGYEIPYGRAWLLQLASVLLFGDDHNYPLEWELSGHDFLSNGLSEALLMSRVLPDFPRWFDAFLPRRSEALDFLTTIPEVLDPTDGRLAHLYGLALTRAWMLAELAEHFDASVLPRAHALAANAQPQLVDGHFMSTHWLITYALRFQLACEGKRVDELR